jgi:hypothetical protein
MKYIITESKCNEFLTSLLEKEGVDVDYLYIRTTSFNVMGTVFLYKDGNVFGYGPGYDFFYKFDERFGTLTYEGHSPDIENFNLLKFLPSEEVVKYFSDKLASHIKQDENFLSSLRKVRQD